MKNLDEKLDKLYNFTLSFVDENGFPPSIRDICKECNIKSTATAYLYIKKLQDKGLLLKTPQKKRAISIKKNNSYESIPILGTVTAGSPILAVENLEGYLPLPPDFNTGNDKFALKVKGESMIKAGIYNGDIVIISQQNTAENGEIIVALIDNDVTIKRFYKKNNKIILHPENDTMKDMIYDNIQILGIVKGLIRKF